MIYVIICSHIYMYLYMEYILECIKLILKLLYIKHTIKLKGKLQIEEISNMQDKRLTFRIWKELLHVNKKEKTNKTIGKRGEWALHKREYPKDQQTHEKMLNSLVIIEMQSPTTMRYPSFSCPWERAKIKSSDDIGYWYDVAYQSFSHTANNSVNGHNFLEASLPLSTKVEDMHTL